jgi:hypothetical protein
MGNLQVCELLLDRGAEINYSNDVSMRYDVDLIVI